MNDEEKKIYDQFMSGTITITLDDEMAQKARECFGFDEMHAEYEFIKNALEKQIPKKPYSIYFDNQVMLGECICGHKIAKVKYCPKCGQRIDWSDEK